MLKGLKSKVSFLSLLLVISAGLHMASHPGNIVSCYTDVRCKNVILMIGDGMGFNSMEKTKAEQGVELVMDSFPLQGESCTACADSDVTDSAAGGSALAAGVRVNAGTVSVYPDDTTAEYGYPTLLTELAVERGRLAGVITTDVTSGATPASFSSHTDSRNNEAEITAQQLAGDLTLVWGRKTASMDQKKAEQNGFQYVTDRNGMLALEEGSRSFGQFGISLHSMDGNKGQPSLAEMTGKAIDLLDDDPDGFFLMVEGASIDKYSHNQDGEHMEMALIEFDRAVAVALDYAKTHRDTMVVVTADHETGGITNIDGKYTYTYNDHTAVNVPLLVYGCDDFIRQGQAINNSRVLQTIAAAMGCRIFPRYTAKYAAKSLTDIIAGLS